MDAGELAVRAEHMSVLDLLEISDAMQIDVGLKEAAVGNVARDGVEFERLDRFVELEEAVLRAVKRPPDLVEAAALPGADQAGQRSERVRWCEAGLRLRRG